MKYNFYFIVSRGEGNNRQRVEEIKFFQEGFYNKMCLVKIMVIKGIFKISNGIVFFILLICQDLLFLRLFNVLLLIY